jgi:hypothetical protein
MRNFRIEKLKADILELTVECEDKENFMYEPAKEDRLRLMEDTHLTLKETPILHEILANILTIEAGSNFEMILDAAAEQMRFIIKPDVYTQAKYGTPIQLLATIFKKIVNT